MVDDRRQDDEFEAPYSEYEDDLDRDDLDRPRRRLNPTALVLAIAVLAALAFLGYSTATRDVPLMTSAAVVLGLVLIVVALTGAVSTVRAGSEGRAGRAFLLAILGGLAGMLAFGCLAVAALLVLVYRLA
jgi:hypothetical protein